MGLGLQNAFGVVGAQDALRQRIKDQLLAEQQRQQMAIQQQELALRLRHETGLDEDRRIDNARQAAAEARLAQTADAAQTDREFTLAPVDSTLAPPLAKRAIARGLPVNSIPGQPVMQVGGFQGGLPGDAGPEGPGMSPVVGSLRVRAPEAAPGGLTTVADDLKSPLSVPPRQTRGATQADVVKQQETDLASRKQDELERNNQANNDLRQFVADTTDKLRSGQLDNASAMLAIRERMAAVAEDAQKTKAAKGISLSAAGKANRGAIEQAAPLTDQALKMMETEFPDIANHPEKYNTPFDKLSSLYQQGKYGLGFNDENDPRRQIVSLLQPIQAGQYTRSSRSRLMVELALKHMADMSQTPAAQYQRMKELKGIMPEMLEGLIRGEAPVDPEHPLAGSYFDPAKQPAAGGDASSALSELERRRAARGAK